MVIPGGWIPPPRGSASQNRHAPSYARTHQSAIEVLQDHSMTFPRYAQGFNTRALAASNPSLVQARIKEAAETCLSGACLRCHSEGLGALRVGVSTDTASTQ